MQKIKLSTSELVLNKGRIYHLNLKPEIIADKIVLVSDPAWVDKLPTPYFVYSDDVLFNCFNNCVLSGITLYSRFLQTSEKDVETRSRRL